MHLYNRGSSYYLVVNVPCDLIPIYRKKQIWVSLRTKDKNIANIRSLMILSKLEYQFLTERQKMSVFKNANIRFTLDYNGMPRPQGTSNYNDVQIENYALDFCITKTEDELPTLSKDFPTLQYYKNLHNEYVLAYKNNDFHLVQDALDIYIASHKMLAPTKECLPIFLKSFMLAYIQYLEMAINYLQGAELKCPTHLRPQMFSYEQTSSVFQAPYSVNTPAQTEVYKKPNLNLSELVKVYNGEASRHNVSKAQKDKINKRIETINLLLNNKKIRDITADDLQELVYLVQFLPPRLNKTEAYSNIKKIIEYGKKHPENCISDKTASDYIQNLKTLFAWAYKRKYIKENPIDEIDIPVFETSKTTAKYQSFTVQQLQTIFHSDFYSKHWDNNRQRRSFFWIGLLGLYTGARLNEICQLQFDDIQEEDGIKFISINENDGKHVKTKAGIRKIPIHQELIKLGFLEFVNFMKKQSPARNKRIFMDLEPNTRGELSAQPSKWFGKLLDSLGLKDKGLVFHSFRHTVRTILRNNNCPIDRVQRLCGWEGSNSLSEHYGTISIKVLAKELNEKLVFEGLNLSHLYI